MKTIDLQAFLAESRIDRVTLERWIAHRWIVATEDGERIALNEVDAARACLIRDLTDDFGVNEEGVDVVLHLVDQLHGMRRMLAGLRAELDATKPREPRD